MEGFTPIELRMLAVLADGLPHLREELHACLYDPDGAMSNIRAHLTSIRKKLRPRGEDVICEMRERVTYYRRARLLASASDGSK